MSNTEQMVNIPREWVEHYAGLLEERCAYEASKRVQAVLAQPPAQHQGEPVALPARKDAPPLSGNFEGYGWNACIDEMAKLGPLYTHADAGALPEWSYCPECGSKEIHHQEGEHKQCGACFQEWFSDIDYSDTVRKHLSGKYRDKDAMIERLRAQLAERDALLREWRHGKNMTLKQCAELNARTDAALSASAEPIPFPGYPPVPEDRKLPAEPSAPVERDELEAEAQRIYESWSDQRGYVPWVARGNSLKQDEARRQARAALERKPSGDIPDFTPGSGNKAERRATELVAQLQADLTERDQRLDQFQQVMQKVATLRGTLDLHGIREEVEALLWPDLHSRPEERGTPETEPCSGCGTPGWTGACAKCVPY